MADIAVEQIRSAIGASPSQRGTLQSLRLGKIGQTAEHPDSPAVRGMLHAVRHLVVVREDAKAAS